MARATVVYLNGGATEPYGFALGRYERQEELCQQRRVYTSADGERAIWWAHGAWYVGAPSSVGKRSGFLTAEENTDVPEDIGVVWKAASAEGGWTEAPAVRCFTEEEHTTLLLAALEGAAEAVYMRGSMPTDVNSFCLGTYTRRPEPLTNDRYVYEHASKAGVLLLWWLTGSWYIGTTDDVGTRRCLLTVEDNAALPEAIAAEWHVASSAGFAPAPDLTCSLTPPAEGEEAPQAASSWWTPQPRLETALKEFTVAVVQHTMAHDGYSHMAARAASVEGLRKAFDAFDIDGSGSISAAELVAILTRQTAVGSEPLAEEDASALISVFDANGDGELDFDEFVKAMTGERTSSPAAPS